MPLTDLLWGQANADRHARPRPLLLLMVFLFRMAPAMTWYLPRDLLVCYHSTLEQSEHFQAYLLHWPHALSQHCALLQPLCLGGLVAQLSILNLDSDLVQGRLQILMTFQSQSTCRLQLSSEVCTVGRSLTDDCCTEALQSALCSQLSSCWTLAFNSDGTTCLCRVLPTSLVSCQIAASEALESAGQHASSKLCFRTCILE